MEYEADWLSGYENSKPVRIGNAAYRQMQLDVFGEVMDSLHFSRRADLGHHKRTWDIQRLLIEYLESLWQQPDYGLWQIHDEVCCQGFDRKLGSFVQAYGSQDLDASLLIIPIVGFLPAGDQRVRGTVEAIATHLMRDGLVARYSPDADVDGLGTTEGAFLLCSFWLADNWAMQGHYDRAVAMSEHLLSLRNDVGLLSEEYDSQARRLLGNFPQAFSHVALINTAYNLLQPEGPSKHRAEA